MTLQRRYATGFLSVACLVILICIGIRGLGLPALTADPSISAQTSEVADGPSACDLSFKSLQSVSPEVTDMALLLMAILILIFPPLIMHLPRLYLRPSQAPPERRIHLCHCVFRE
ncbi:hypothetical protein [Pantoea sp. BAV 3049]|uniref:hypothetical protein n=1 Tax=Pantoea sp. BAV 3049 TaxID=2654188 RepID=UPI00131E6C63|nr:hypothetical protein [Pantoea sp. BAV 3049]